MELNNEQLRVLIVDDEPGIRQTICSILEDEGCLVCTCENATIAKQRLLGETWDLVFLDIWLPDRDGLVFFREEPSLFAGLALIMISGHGTIDMAVQAVKLGAHDFIEKPLSYEKLISSVQGVKTVVRLRHENERLRSKLQEEDSIIGRSPASLQLQQMVKQAAGNNVPVFISGENGTGKELVARTIHRSSKRVDKPFIAVNCAAIPENLIESELFGHEKGAFTGAVARKKGRFELANFGTLFLDEVLDLSVAAQAKLLRVLQEQEFERVGGEQSLKVDIRIISASNKNIQEEVKAGRFREDLFYRLHVLPVSVPPLRERSLDIPLLVEYFFVRESDSQARPVPEIELSALNNLQAFSWPGNVRQLRNIVQRLLVSCDEVVSEADVRNALGLDGTVKTASLSDTCEDFWNKVTNLSLHEAKESFEEHFLLQQLQKHGYNVTRTAQDLGMYPSNLHAKIRKYGFER